MELQASQENEVPEDHKVIQAIKDQLERTDDQERMA